MYNTLVFYQHKGVNMSCNLGVEDWRVGDKERIINATGDTQSIACLFDSDRGEGIINSCKGCQELSGLVQGLEGMI